MPSKTKKNSVQGELVLVLILLIAFTTRIYLLILPQPMAPGDAYSFINIAREITELKYSSARRLPVFPLLLIPGVVFLEDINQVVWLERWISVFSSLGSLLLAYLICRKLNVGRNIAYAAIFYLSFQSYFLINSIRPYEKSFFAFMVLLSVYAYYSADTRNKKILFGVVLGLTCMTRYEGFILAVALLSYMFFSEKIGGVKYPLAVLLVLITPWFIKNMIVFGDPFHTGYIDLGKSTSPLEYLRITGIGSFDDLVSHMESTLHVLLSAWSVVPSELSLALVFSDFFVLVSVVALLFTLLGVFAFYRMVGSRGIPLIIFFLLFVVFLTWAVERGKYVVPITPLLSLFLISGLFELNKIRSFGRQSRIKNIFSFIMLASASLSIFYSSLYSSIERVEERVITAERQLNMGVSPPPDTLSILRQDKDEDWDGVYIDFLPDLGMLVHNITFNVVFVKGSEYEMDFDWYIGRDNGSFDVADPLLVKKSFVPEWRLGEQTIVLDAPYELKAGVKYTLYVKTLKKKSVAENQLFVRARDSPDGTIYYGIRRNNPEWANAQARVLDIDFR